MYKTMYSRNNRFILAFEKNHNYIDGAYYSIDECSELFFLSMHKGHLYNAFSCFRFLMKAYISDGTVHATFYPLRKC